EQEQTDAVTARRQVERTAADTERTLARERAAAAAAVEELKEARVERQAAELERAKAVSAKERAEQAATETAQALARERTTAVMNREDLDRARIEREAAAQALLVRVAKLKEALDEQRQATVSLARDLAAARGDNDRLRTERRSAQIEPPLKPRSGRAAASQVKAVSKKIGKVRNPSRMTRVRSITLPYSLLPRHVTPQ
ncbi:hypothetical protein EN953_24730, partial [Mesorhizobium sp. M7A.F.Ca.CA.001.04.1.1]